MSRADTEWLFAEAKRYGLSVSGRTQPALYAQFDEEWTEEDENVPVYIDASHWPHSLCVTQYSLLKSYTVVEGENEPYEPDTISVDSRGLVVPRRHESFFPALGAPKVTYILKRWDVSGARGDLERRLTLRKARSALIPLPTNLSDLVADYLRCACILNTICLCRAA